ncbi:MAG: hypothetical protein EXS37_07520 [Opitutus sp.]|nr:hypothetical protein [Opitutus sp.]
MNSTMRIDRIGRDLSIFPIASTGGGGDKMSVTERRKRDIPVTNPVADGDTVFLFIRSAAPMVMAMQSARQIAEVLEATPNL